VDAAPSFVIVGGLCFLPMSQPLVDEGMLEEYTDPVTAGHLLAKIGSPRRAADEQVVVLAKLLESELSIGCDECVGRPLLSVNDTPVRSLAQLAALVAERGTRRDPFLKFGFGQGRVAVLSMPAARAAEADLLATHDIAHWCSADVDPRPAAGVLPRISALFGGCSPRAGGEQAPAAA